jgi:hypothetical protein
MDKGKSGGQEYNTESSSYSFYAVHVDMDVEGKKSIIANDYEMEEVDVNNATSSTALSLLSSNMLLSSNFGAQFQEVVMRMLMQSIGALTGPPTSVVSSSQGIEMGMSILYSGRMSPP